MNKQTNILRVSVLLLSVMVLYSCQDEPTPSKHVFLSLDFDHRVNNKEVVLNTQSYTNAANNTYRLDEIKYFISSLHLYKGGNVIKIKQDNGLHYVDLSYKNTMKWEIADLIPEGFYDSIGFTFGLDHLDNRSYRFTNPPESNMSWPSLLGGGYHYMMLNGWYFQGDTMKPLNIHLGKGQIYSGNTHDPDSVIGFVDNHFYVCLPKSFLVKRDRTTSLTIVMHVDNWFENPFTYNFNDWGNHIMQNQPAMQMIKENGHNVFTVE